MPNLGSSEQSTVILIEIIIWDAVLIYVNNGVSSNDFCVPEPRFWHIFYQTLPPPKGNISVLAMVTTHTSEAAL